MMMNAGFASGQTALPLSRENFVNALANATSGPQEQILLGGQQLESWEKQPGYSTFLQVRTGLFATVCDSCSVVALWLITSQMMTIGYFR